MVASVHRWSVFQNHIPQSSEVYTLGILIVQGYILHFTLCCMFSGRGAKYRKRIVFRVTRYKLLNEGARAVIVQLISEVAQIILCFDVWGLIILPNKDDRVCITVQHRLPQITQILVQFYPSLCCYVGRNCHVNILPVATLASEYLQETQATSPFGNVRFVTSVPGHVNSS